MRATLVFGVVLALGACGGFDEAEVARRGAAALMPFKTELKQTLIGALKEGPDAAIDACAVKAPEIARRASHDGVKVGRASKKLRNPGNQAMPWVEPFLDGIDGPRVVDLGDGRAGYLEPIRVEALCTTCHGAAIGEPIAGRIKERYPLDQAVGYAEGDFRGVFWVELDAR